MKFGGRLALSNNYSGNSKWYSLAYKKYPLIFIPVEIHNAYDDGLTNRICFLEQIIAKARGLGAVDATGVLHGPFWPLKGISTLILH